MKKPKPWTKDELTVVSYIALHTNHFLPYKEKEIAKLLGRSYAALRKKIFVIRHTKSLKNPSESWKHIHAIFKVQYPQAHEPALRKEVLEILHKVERKNKIKNFFKRWLWINQKRTK